MVDPATVPPMPSDEALAEVAHPVRPPVGDAVEQQPGQGSHPGWATWRGPRGAAAAFVVILAVGTAVILSIGREQWFFLDEWVFLASRDISVDGLMQPHNEHWVLVPVLVYRTLWRLVGIRSYFPYQAVVVGFHVGAAILLRAVMRRAGATPWLSTLLAGAFLLFGSGRQDIVWAFQISFTGAFTFGLAQLLLADHGGRPGWRDLAGLACGLAAIACSGIGVVMVAVVGLSTWLRRGWRAAALHVVPLAAVWMWWWLTYGRDRYDTTAGPSGAVSYAWDGFTNAVARMGDLPGVGVVLVVLTAAGIASLFARGDRMATVRRIAMPLALALGVVLFLAVTGYGRAGRTGNDVPQATRYVYLVGGMLVPLVAVALSELARRHVALGALGALVVLMGVPGNVAALHAGEYEQLTLGSPRELVAGAHLPVMREVPRDHHPFGWFAGSITAGWIVDAVDQGKVGDPPDMTAQERATLTLDVASRVSPARGALDCRPLTAPMPRHMAQGESFAVRGQPLVVTLRDGGVESAAREVPPGSRFTSLAALDLTLRPAAPGAPTQLCA